jgi:RNA polymerase sigma factor (sigma-70 family)
MANVNDMDDFGLLREYAGRGSEEAFALLVKRQINLVYSVALRRVTVAAHAEEITQAVFVILARKAGSLRPGIILEGWLHETTRLTAMDFLRGERRRQLREQEAFMESTLHSQHDNETWAHLAPLLDEAIGKLGAKERDAVVLRYFKNNSVRQMAVSLGIKEDAAQQRILRAVEKLRVFFSRRGVTFPAAAITTAMAVHSVKAAPVALANSVAVLAAAQGAGASASTLAPIKGGMKIMAWSKFNAGMAAAVIVASIAVPLMVEHRAQAKWTEDDVVLAQQKEQLAKLEADNAQRSQAGANSTAQNQWADLERLRGEAVKLRQQTNELASLQVESKQLRARNGLDKPKTAGQIQAETRAKMSFQQQWMLSTVRFISDHDGQYPTNFGQMGTNVAPVSMVTSTVGGVVTTNDIELVYGGKLSAITNAATTIVLREAESWNTGASSNPTDLWAKIYGFADGHIEIHQQVENNFDDYERQHIIGPASNGQ